MLYIVWWYFIVDGTVTSIKLPCLSVLFFFTEMKVLKVYIEFSLDQPKGGLHFVVPDVEGSMAERAAHVFSFGNQNSTR